MSNPSPEDIQRVRDYECKMAGHRWDVIETMGRETPVAVVCGNCGLKAKVEDPSHRDEAVLVEDCGEYLMTPAAIDALGLDT